MISSAYRSQVELLLSLLPEVAKERAFALKGGTAINLFVRDMPRLSVDIDLTYLPFDDRETAIGNIAVALHRIKDGVDKSFPEAFARVLPQSGGQEAKLMCRWSGASVVVEVNTVMRGHMWPVQQLQLVKSAQDEYRRFATATVVSHAELFGGKLCAALDRQHPRDLFDIRQLFDNEGIDNDLRLGFIAALLSHTRPMHELLRPHWPDMRAVFESQFVGMSAVPFSYDDFDATRKQLVEEIHAFLTEDDRDLLVSVKKGEPDWKLFPHEALPQMPAVQWKLENIQTLKKNKRKHAEQLKMLEETLND